MEWKYIKMLEDVNSIKEVEEKYNVVVPNYLKELIMKFNGARPSKTLFITKSKKEKVVKSLISYNKEDRENIYIFDDILNKGYIPFAITEFGDLVCINSQNNMVELYNHELDEFEDICKSIEEFFEAIY